MNTPFKFTQIEGKITLEEAGKELVRLATLMRDSHNQKLVDETPDSDMQHTLFRIRKDGVMCLLELMNQYLEQLP